MALAALSAALLGVAMPGIDAWPLAFFGLAPFLWAMRRRQGGGAFRLGAAFGFFFCYGSIFWLNSLYIFATVAPAGIAILAAYGALYFAVWSWAGVWLWRRTPRWALASLPSLWALLEWLRGLGALAVPLFFLSHTQWDNLPFIQIADLGGAPLVSFFLVGVNVALVEAFDRWRERKRGAAAARLFLAALVALAPFAYGAARMAVPPQDGKRIRIAVSQPNVNQFYKLLSYSHPDLNEQANMQRGIEENQVQQIRRIANDDPDAELYILPETTFTERDLPGNARLRERIAGLCRETDAGILFGEENRYWDAMLGREKMFNSMFMATPEEGVLDVVYDKMLLIPFGETLSIFRYIPFLKDDVLGMGEFDAGTEYTLFSFRGMRFGVAICFESTNPRHVARLAKEGAQFLVVSTNDAWYVHPKWSIDKRGPAQHDAHSTFRAIENRRWLARSANTGISRIVDPLGRTVQRLGVDERGFLSGEIAARDGLTLYARFGGWFPIACVVLLLEAWRRGNRKTV